MDSRIAHFDPNTARFALRGSNQISFADPMTAKAAGYIVAPRPEPVAGAVSVASVEPVSVLRRPSVICVVAGTEHRPPPPKPEARPLKGNEVDAPKSRRRA